MPSLIRAHDSTEPLQLSFYLEPRDCWRLQAMDTGGEVLLDARLYRKTLVVEVVRVEPAGSIPLARFSVRLERPITCALSARGPERAGCLDSYKAELLRRARSSHHGLSRLTGFAADGLPRAGSWARFAPFAPILAFVRQWVHDRLDRRAVLAAANFPDDLLWPVYALLAEDATGRMAQMATVCPGVILCCCGLAKADPVGHEELVRAIVEGRRLNQVLDIAADGWLAARRERGRTAAWRAQRVKIRRACAHVPWSMLDARPPRVMVPDDIPPAHERDENIAWYEAMRALDQQADDPPLAPDAADALCRFVSRNIRQLVALARNLHTLTNDLGFIQRHLGDTGERISPRANVARVRHEARLAFARGTVSSNRPLMAAPLTRWRSPDRRAVLEQILIAGDLHAEGQAMGHCVGSYDLLAVQGEDFFYRGKVDGLRVTVHVQRSSSGALSLVEARHEQNGEVGPEHLHLLAAMLNDPAWSEGARRAHVLPPLPVDPAPEA